MSTPILGLDDFDFEIDSSTKKRKSVKWISLTRKLLALVIVMIVSIGGTYVFLEYQRSGENTIISENESTDDGEDPIEPEVLGLNSCEDPDASSLKNLSAWWDEDFDYSNKLDIHSNEFLEDSNTLKLTFNHASLVDEGKSKENGDDLRLVLEVEGNFLQLPYEIIDTNSSSTKILFRLNPDYAIDVANYYLYYGNSAATPKSRSMAGQANDESSYSISLQGENTFPISISTDKTWALKQYQSEPLMLDVKLSSNIINDNIAVNYEIERTDLTGAIIPEGNKYTTNINIDDLDSGEYIIRASVSDNCFSLKSQPEKVIVSYPVFVVWSMDWEGRDVNRNYLNQITEISDEFDIPLTQLFNPRIYITNSISQSQKTYMDNWIKDRREQGDEIGLHLHMWNDMIREAGLTPKTTPRWAGLNSGYDVLLTSYNTQETDQIIKWALAEMERNGFNDLTTFRAGGWEIDEENMAALELNGFKIDTSGRTNHKLGTNLLRSGWDLAPNQKPYQPSKTDINTTSADHFNLWEFPNNGADSYLYSYEQMLERFELNYNQDYMDEPQVITYLSHPHWFNIDYPKLKSLFADIDQYNYADDNGPVVFSTLENAYNYWTDVVE